VTGALPRAVVTAGTAAVTFAAVAVVAFPAHPGWAVAVLAVALVIGASAGTAARRHPLGPLPARAAGYLLRRWRPRQNAPWRIEEMDGIGVRTDPDGWLAVIEVDVPARAAAPDAAALTGRIGRGVRPRVAVTSLIGAGQRRVFVAVRVDPTLVSAAGVAPLPALRASLAYAERVLKEGWTLDAAQLAAALDAARGGSGRVAESWDHLRLGPTWQATVHAAAASVPPDLAARLVAAASGAAFAVDHGPAAVAVRCLAPTPAGLVAAVGAVRDAVHAPVTGSGGAQVAAMHRTMPMATSTDSSTHMASSGR
jgi:hypothetical protein